MVIALISIIGTVVVHLSTEVTAVLVGIVLPLVTGIVTKLRAGSAVKAVSTAVLSVLTGLVTTLISEPEHGLVLYDAAFATALAFVSSIATYYGIWKPTGVAPAVQSATASFGVGSDSEGNSTQDGQSSSWPIPPAVKGESINE